MSGCRDLVGVTFWVFIDVHAHSIVFYMLLWFHVCETFMGIYLKGFPTIKYMVH